MDFEDLFKLLPLLLWALSRMLSQRRKGSQEAPDGKGEAQAPQLLSRRAAADVEELEGRARSILDSLDPPSRATFAGWLTGRIATLGDRRERLAAIAGAEGASHEQVLQLRGELDDDRSAIAAVATVVERRGATSPLQTTADTLLDQVYSPLEPLVQDRTAGPTRPLVVVGADERLLRSSIRPALVMLPSALGSRPWLWPLLGAELGRYLLASLPGFRGEIDEALALDTGEEELRPDSEALAKLLFSAWSAQLIADLTATQLFGSAWLEMMVREAGQEADPRAVTGVALDGRGGLLPTPPDHVRVLLAAHWLSSMGDESGALDWSRRWSAAHGDPQALHFAGSQGAGSMPLEPLMSHLRRLVERFDGHSFRALGNSTFSGLPGLAGWNALEGQARRAQKPLSTGAPAQAPARALVAATTRAGVEAPGRAMEIQAALAASLTGPLPRARPRRPSVGTPRRPARRPAYVRRIAEALVLSELFEPRAR